MYQATDLHARAAKLHANAQRATPANASNISLYEVQGRKRQAGNLLTKTASLARAVAEQYRAANSGGKWARGGPLVRKNDGSVSWKANSLYPSLRSQLNTMQAVLDKKESDRQAFMAVVKHNANIQSKIQRAHWLAANMEGQLRREAYRPMTSRNDALVNRLRRNLAVARTAANAGQKQLHTMRLRKSWVSGPLRLNARTGAINWDAPTHKSLQAMSNATHGRAGKRAYLLTHSLAPEHAKRLPKDARRASPSPGPSSPTSVLPHAQHMQALTNAFLRGNVLSSPDLAALNAEVTKLLRRRSKTLDAWETKLLDAHNSLSFAYSPSNYAALRHR